MDTQINYTPSDTLQRVNILWTGGFDSSYRMVQLSKHNLIIQPYYLVDKRPSEHFELNAMSLIISDILNHPETKCTILPLIKIKVSEIDPDSEITDAFIRIQKLINLGSQYDWLSRFAKSQNGLEICFEKNEVSKLYHYIWKNAILKRVTEGEIAYFIFDFDKSKADILKVFGRFRIPLPLFELTKTETFEDYKKLGFENTVKKTWFCHTPVNNEPCGICNPCKAVVDEGLKFRLSPAGLKRYKSEIKYNNHFWFKYYKIIRYRFVGY